MLDISVIVPIYNEEENIRTLYNRLTDTLKKDISDDYEIIFVNDGSKDSSITIIKSLASLDNKVKYIDLSRNFGHQNAVFAGMNYVNGASVVIIDADLQDPPETIIDLYRKMKEGFDVVYAQRIVRNGESWHKKLTAKYFYL